MFWRPGVNLFPMKTKTSDPHAHLDLLTAMHDSLLVEDAGHLGGDENERCTKFIGLTLYSKHNAGD